MYDYFSSKGAHFEKDIHFSEDAHGSWVDAQQTFKDAGEKSFLEIIFRNQKKIRVEIKFFQMNFHIFDYPPFLEITTGYLLN